MNIQEQITQKEREIEILKNQLQNCNHIWAATVNDYQTKTDWVPNYSRGLIGHGSDYNYETIAQTKTIPRWSRTCDKCGKKEYSYIQKVIEVKTEAKF